MARRSLNPALLIGNDLIDLRARHGRGKARHGAFVRRVFTPDEAARIRAAPDPDYALWLLWAGKEAAYKIARKLRPGTPFVHRAFEVVPALDDGGGAWPGAVPGSSVRESADALGPAPQLRRGSVQLHRLPGLDGVSFAVEWETTASFIHCIASEHTRATAPAWWAVTAQVEPERDLARREPARELRPRARDGHEAGPRALTERECVSARTAESIAVRRLAHRLAREAGLGAIEIVRERTGRGLGPPRLFRAGSPEPLAGWDISLSHDGRLGAAALSGPPAPVDAR